ncbi:dTMP kinase [Dactylosporangium siamense]|uniref:Thymidylate kinase n=1 Tax=Dactylosporangium siamense TaxID=685454 RepID=A0A919PVV1_9ACTN|nr:thymidylate kinase [Dactylosporangium siamense]GIG51202.1 thymidylate kinase [Dactylosporangium siamense]
MALIGIDGAGKSTQARWLADWLDASGVPARYHRNAAGRVFFGRLAQRLGRRDAEHLLGVRLFLLVETLLRGLVITRALLLSRLTGTVAVMDRYTYCQYTSITVRGGRPRLARLLFRLLPQPELVLYLAVPPLVAQARVDARGKDHEDLDYLTACDAAYRGLPEAGRFTVVDAGTDPSAVQTQLREAVQRDLLPDSARRHPSRAAQHLLPIG